MSDLFSHEAGNTMTEEMRRNGKKRGCIWAIGLALRTMWRGFTGQWAVILGIGETEPSIFVELLGMLSLTLPVCALVTYIVATEGYTVGNEIHTFLCFVIGFLVVIRLEVAYRRFWEARHHLATAKTALLSVALVVITQYHRHYGDPAPAVHTAIDDVRRYLLLYFCTLVNQARGLPLEQENIEEHITEAELKLLKTSRAPPPSNAIKWMAGRLTALEEMGYLSPLQLHETNEGIEHMSEALDELLKIAETPPPFPIRQMSSAFTTFFVYTAPFMLATTFTAELGTFTGVLGRTLLSTFLLGICYLAINTVAKTFENPLRGDSRQAVAALPMLAMCHEMNIELLGLFREPIPPVVGVNDAAEEARRAKIESLGSVQSPKERRGGNAIPIKALKVRVATG